VVVAHSNALGVGDADHRNWRQAIDGRGNAVP
jgi:hypothetical protein